MSAVSGKVDISTINRALKRDILFHLQAVMSTKWWTFYKSYHTLFTSLYRLLLDKTSPSNKIHGLTVSDSGKKYGHSGKGQP